MILITKYEHALDNLQQRIHSWLRTDVNMDIYVLSAETVDIYGKDDDERNLERALEDCFQSNRLGSLNMYSFSALRLFYYIVPKEEKSSVTKCLSAGTNRVTMTMPKLICQESASSVKRQRWTKNNTSQQEGGGGADNNRTPKQFRYQQPNTNQTDQSSNNQIFYQHKTTALSSRRPTTQLDSTMVLTKFDDRIRSRSSSTSCNCM